MWGGDPRTWIDLGGPCRGGQASKVAQGGTVGPATVVVELLRGRALGWGGPAVLRGARLVLAAREALAWWASREGLQRGPLWPLCGWEAPWGSLIWPRSARVRRGAAQNWYSSPECSRSCPAGGGVEAVGARGEGAGGALAGSPVEGVVVAAWMAGFSSWEVGAGAGTSLMDWYSGFSRPSPLSLSWSSGPRLGEGRSCDVM